MTIRIGRRDRPDVQTIDIEAAKEQLAAEGFSSFPENIRGYNVALLNPELAEYAVEELGYDAQSLSEELGYKLKPVEKILVHHGLLEEDETSLTEFEYSDAVKWNPTKPRPHPKTVHRPSGTADRTPWK